jgi:glucose/arabinose dehydrogenase
MRQHRLTPQCLAIASLLGLSVAQAVAAPATLGRIEGVAEVTELVSGLEHPGGLAFLPDGRALVTERPGRLRIVSREGALSEPVAGVPKVYASGQGGLLDIAVDPAFASNGLVYLSFAEAGEGGAGTAVARGRLDGERLEDVEVIFRQQPKVEGGNHFGSRLVFGRDGTLFVTMGDRFNFRKEAQNLESHIGKVVRINTDGSVPADNPFRDKPGAKPEIWSYGHRNVQGAALNPATGELWTAEHGARGGDEINRVLAGRNYGWPVISYGVHYSGAKIGTGRSAPGMEQPVFYWDPSIAPSGLAFYTGERYPGWNGTMLVGALRGSLLANLTLSGNAVTKEERVLAKLRKRIRDVRQGPDGLVYVVTDEDNGRILRLDPIQP